jgi:predicted dehydrogenase
MGPFTSERPLRIGLLGAAKIAPPAVITPAAARSDVVISAVAARDPARAAAFAQTHAIPAVAEDYDALVRREDVDLVYNALPIAAHAEWSIRALQAGKPVLCEKAFAINQDQARAMVAAAVRADLPLIEAFHYRFHPVMLRAIEIVRSGELGPLAGAVGKFCVPIAYRPDEIRWRADQGGGALGDLGSYPAHALRTLIGEEPEVVRASIERMHGVDATVTAELKFPGDIAAELACSMTAERPVAEVIVRGERGRLHVMNFVAPHLGARFTVRIGERLRDEATDGPTTYAAQLDHVVEVMNGRAGMVTGGRDAIANMALLDAIRAAA